MKKLLYILLLLPFIASAQTNGIKVGAPIVRNAGTDAYPTGYSHLINGGRHSYATLAGRDSLNSYYPGLLRDGMEVFVRATNFVYRWNNSTTTWDIVSYGNVYTAGYGLNLAGLQFRVNQSVIASRAFVSDTTNRYINLNSGDDLSFNSAQWRDKQQVNYYCSYNPAFPLVSADPTKPFGYFWMGTVLVDKTTGTGIMRATQWDIELGKVMNEYIRVKDDTQSDWAAWTKIWTDGALPLGTPGQSIRVNSGGTAFEAYTPAVATTPTLQSVATAGNSYTGRLSAQGYDISGTGGNGFSFFPSQSTMPGTPTGGFNLFADANGRFSWKSPLGFTRTIASTALTADRVYNFSDASYTVPGLELANIFTNNQSISYSGTPTFSLINPTSGSTTSFSQSASLNKFLLNVKSIPAGGIGGAVQLNGTNQAVSQPSTFTSAGAFTIAFWYQQITAQNAQIVSAGGGTDATSFSIRTPSGGGLSVYHSGSVIGTSVIPSPSRYYHIAYTFDGTQGRFYIDGVQQGSATTITTPSITASQLNIGRSTSSAQYTNANYDQMLFYNTNLSQSQIQSLVNSGFGTPSVPLTGNLVRRLDFETSGTLLYEAVGGGNATGSNSPSFNPAGKVPLASAGSLSDNSITETEDGKSFAEPIIIYNGGKSALTTNNITGRFVGIYSPSGYSLQQGANSWIALGKNMSDLRDVNGNVANSGVTFYPGNSSTEGHIQWVPASTIPTPSTSRNGVQTYGTDGRMNFITNVTGSTTTQQFAYLSDITSAARGRVNVAANQTMTLNYDYLNASATQYTLTLPPTTGFTTDGSSIITVLVSGTGGARISVPSGYALQSGSAFATTTGTGGATLVQGQKVQLIPVGTNSYYLQPLNGSVTIN